VASVTLVNYNQKVFSAFRLRMVPSRETILTVGYSILKDTLQSQGSALVAMRDTHRRLRQTRQLVLHAIQDLVADAREEQLLLGYPAWVNWYLGSTGSSYQSSAAASTTQSLVAMPPQPARYFPQASYSLLIKRLSPFA
jgi:hypothetical protein